MVKQDAQKVVRKRTTALRQTSNETEAQFASLPTKVFIIVLSVSALLVGLYIQLTKNISESLSRQAALQATNQGDTLIIAENLDAGYLDHVVDALLNFGHQLSFRSAITLNNLADLHNYKLIWTHDYPFENIKKLDPSQRINHFPGTGFITNKPTLSTTPRVPHLLKAFRLPYELDKFLEYSKQFPNTTWIQKSSSHRGISIETKETLNLSLNGSLIQEYMSNPLLIGGKKFDIGIYAVLTSVEPLRVYIYDAESLIRFCAHPYLNKQTGQFNASDLDSYIVGDDYTPMWTMPALLRYYIGTNLSMKQTLNSYLKSLGKSGDKIWSQIEETIKVVYKMKESHIARMSRMYQEANLYNSTSVEGSLNQFFEMVRFDFIVDDELNVYLMEANMSPNLSSRHFPPNRLIYEQVLNSFFSLTGLTQFAVKNLQDLPTTFIDGRRELPRDRIKREGGRVGLDAIVSDKELSVYEDLCVSDECHMNCMKSDCKICYFCLDSATKLHLKRAIFENHSKWNFKRLLPSTFDADLDLQLINQESNQQLMDANHVHIQWFRGKCFSEKQYCSF